MTLLLPTEPSLIKEMEMLGITEGKNFNTMSIIKEKLGLDLFWENIFITIYSIINGFDTMEFKIMAILLFFNRHKKPSKP